MRQLALYYEKAVKAETRARADRIEEIRLAVWGDKQVSEVLKTLREV